MHAVSTTTAQTQVRINQFIRSVYNWMAVGLGLTGLVAFYVAGNESLLKVIFGNRLLFFGLIIGQLVLVFHPQCKGPHGAPQRQPVCSYYTRR